jgi:hypothetical protein
LSAPFSSSSSSSSSASAGAAKALNLRKMLGAFLMRAHPDVLHGQPAPVRAANERSLQSLNSFLDLAEARCNVGLAGKGGGGRGGGAGGDDGALEALPNSFDLEFYVPRARAAAAGEGDGEQAAAGERTCAAELSSSASSSSSPPPPPPPLTHFKLSLRVPTWLLHARGVGVAARQWREFTAQSLERLLRASHVGVAALAPLRAAARVGGGARGGGAAAHSTGARRRRGKGAAGSGFSGGQWDGGHDADDGRSLGEVFADCMEARPMAGAAAHAALWDHDPLRTDGAVLERVMERAAARQALVEGEVEALFARGAVLVDTRRLGEARAAAASLWAFEMLASEYDALQLGDPLWDTTLLLLSDHWAPPVLMGAGGAGGGKEEKAPAVRMLTVQEDCSADELRSHVMEHLLMTAAFDDEGEEAGGGA